MGFYTEANRARFSEILVDVTDGIAWITLNRPHVLNARNLAMRRELIDACSLINRDPAVAVVVITGAGDRAFCVGKDLKEAAADFRDPLEMRRDHVIYSDTLAVEGLDKPVIAAINGYALGGGLELALCCDIRITAETATFGFPEAGLGTIPGSGGTQRLSRLVGPSSALKMMMTAQRVPANEAFRIGLVNEVVPYQDLKGAADSLARKISDNSPVAVKLIKEAVRKGQDLPLVHALSLERDLASLSALSEDSREGPLAFVEKRPPVWRS